MSRLFRIKAEFVKYTLQFKFDAGTSRGVLKSKDTFIIRVQSPALQGLYGYGEAGPLPGLSVDDRADFEILLAKICKDISQKIIPQHEEEILNFLSTNIPAELPSIRFGLEVALLDLMYGGQKKILVSTFYDNHKPLIINGLIWMGDREFMLQQIEQKLGEGYNCIKMKIGSIDFEQECALLSFIRRRYSPEEITLRVDANGAFSKEEALYKLHRLEEFGLHSIEQPIRAGQWEAMRILCLESPIPIALDEELIGLNNLEDKILLLETINPQYIIVKPTLLGGILSSREWIRLAGVHGMGWWITSALESNIGLNAIAQLAATYDPIIPQGLGTGQLYHNNIDSPLRVRKGNIFYGRENKWGELRRLFDLGLKT